MQATLALALVGVKLPGLEFNNQKVEAAYRKELVLGEDDGNCARPPTLKDLFHAVRKNNYRLYWHYMYFDIARWSYLQFAVIMPYIVLAPSLLAGALTLGGNSELQTRPYGPTGLSQLYGVTVGFTPIEDSGGPLTVKALKDGDIQLANIYSSDPALADGTLRVLDDPKGLFLASHVVPLASSRVNDDAAAVINRVSAAMDAEDLVEMNRASTVEQKSASQIAREWLVSEGLLS